MARTAQTTTSDCMKASLKSAHQSGQRTSPCPKPRGHLRGSHASEALSVRDLLLRLSLLGPDVIAQFRSQTDGVKRAARWRRRDSVFDHQLSKERTGLRLDD